MSLNYDYSKIPKDSPTISEHDEDKMHPVLNALIWLTMPIGLYEITEKNLDEWEARLRIYEGTFGAWLRKTQGKGKPPVDTPITRAELEQYVGLGTNASSLTRAKFMKQVAQRVDREVREARMHREKNAAAEAAA